MSRACSVLISLSLIACSKSDTPAQPADQSQVGAAAQRVAARAIDAGGIDAMELIVATLSEGDDLARMPASDRADKECMDAAALLERRVEKHPTAPEDWRAWWHSAGDTELIATEFHGAVALPDAATGPKWGLVIGCQATGKKARTLRLAALIVHERAGRLQLYFSHTLARQGCCGHSLFTPETIEVVDINRDGHSELHIRGPYESLGGSTIYFHGDQSHYIFPDTARPDGVFTRLFRTSPECESGVSANLLYEDRGFSILRSGHLHDFQPMHKYVNYFTQVETRLSRGKKLPAPHAGHELLVRTTYREPARTKKAGAYLDAFYSGGQKGAIHDSIVKFKQSAKARDILRWNAEGRWLEIECKGKARLERGSSY